MRPIEGNPAERVTLRLPSQYPSRSLLERELEDYSSAW